MEKTNDPTPRSISEVPQVSTLANLRGNTGKSTAKIAKAVMIIIEPRYAVMKGFFGRNAVAGADAEPFVSLVRWRWLCFEVRLTRTAGVTIATANVNGEEAYIVIDSSSPIQFNKKSTVTLKELHFCPSENSDEFLLIKHHDTYPTSAIAVTALISPIDPPLRPETNSSLRSFSVLLTVCEIPMLLSITLAIFVQLEYVLSLLLKGQGRQLEASE